MLGKTKQPNADERRHMERVQQLGCLACWIEGIVAPAEIHHVTDGSRRLGHRYVIPLCSWHHRGQSETGMRPSDAESLFGPSLAHDKASFTRHYGTERELLNWIESLIEEEATDEA